MGATHELRHRADVLSAFARAHLRSSDGRPGVIHAHVVYPDGAAAVSLAEVLGWPLIVTEHSSMVDQIVSEPAVRAAYEATLAAANRVLAVSGVLSAGLQAGPGPRREGGGDAERRRCRRLCPTASG